ncbi:ATP-binding cassette domain-containing protein [Saccharopolyspora tripterygii]
MTTQIQTSALTVNGLTKTYRTGRALDDASFSLPQGAIAALVGANGSGKSTLLSLLAGLLEPDAGTVSVFGEDLGEGAHPRVAFLAQRRPLYADMTVRDNLRIVAALNDRWNDDRAREVLDRGRIRLEAKVRTLSEGQRAMVGAALALSREPDLLLLDEPLAGLDPLAREDLLRILMADVADRGTTLLMSAHVLSDLEAICDHLVLLEDGCVRLAGEIDYLLSGHRVLVGPHDVSGAVPAEAVIDERRTDRQATVLVRGEVGAAGGDVERPSLEALVIGYLRAGRERS